MDLVSLINQISNDEIRASNFSELYDSITRRRRIYLMKTLLIYIFIVSLIICYYWKQVKGNLYYSILIFLAIPFIPASIYTIYTTIINPRYHYSEFILYITRNDDYRVIEINSELIKEKLKEIHGAIQDSDELCTICMTNNINIKLKCSNNGFHGGCYECLIQWYKKSNTCPECREKIFDNNTFI